MHPLVSAILFAAAFLSPAASVEDLSSQAIFVAPSENTPEDALIVAWQQRALNGKPEALERLGWAYVTKARATLDDGYYTLALLTADTLAARHGPSAGERLLRGHVLHNLHRFKEAEVVARELLQQKDAPPQAAALLSDALLEQGRIQEATAALEQFVRRQPGLQAYSRIAHLRWLKGDLGGAEDAMLTAMRASSPRDGEPHAWVLVRLAGYELQQGTPGEALAFAEAALRVKPDLGSALLARGQALLALDRAAEAVPLLRRAAAQVPQPIYLWWLADAQLEAGDVDGAAATEQSLARHAARTDPRTYALYLATRGREATEAVKLARRELEARSDPHTHDALAWALLAVGDAAGADAAMKRALAAGTEDPRLNLHAAIIARAAGRHDEATERLARAASGAAALLPSERARLAAERASAGRTFSDNALTKID